MKKISRRRFMQATGKMALAGATLSPGAVLLSGCKTMKTLSQVGAQVGVSSGLVSSSQAQSLVRTGTAVARTFEDFTPEQEYYIGRTVGAMILQKYRHWNNQPLTRYVNVLGQVLARASDLPETYGGYHFLVQNTSEVNALAAPGGLIFVTRGMLRCCRNEASLAGVLAHEIGHVQHRHGLQAIKKSRITSALTTIGMEGAKSFGGKELASLTRTFEGSISDITGTLINNGYSRGFEREADQAAITILERIGYDPNGLVQMLQNMQSQLKPGGLDFAKTHPSPESRITDIKKRIDSFKPARIPKARARRFTQAMANV